MTFNETGQESHDRNQTPGNQAPRNQAPGFETSSTGPGDTMPDKPARSYRLWRARTVLVFGAVGAVVIASAAAGITLNTRNTSGDRQSLAGNSSSSQSTTAGQGASSQGSTGTRGGSASLIPRRGDGSAFESPLTSNATNATAATASQAIGVVLINTVLKYQNAEAAGTGIILTSSGEILTNNHVVDGATSISVTIASTGKTQAAKVVGTDAARDIAVLSLDGASGLKAAAVGSSSDARVADAVTAVGNAGGAGTLSAATGKIASFDQTITASGESGSNAETLNGLIETNADVVAGDSGGPLYNSSAQVIGIDTAASSRSAGTTGYAIPISTALSIARQIENGKSSSTVTIGYPAFLGVEVAANAAGSTADGQIGQTVAGATVAGVVGLTPAATAGLVAGDTITAVDSTAIMSPNQLSSVLGADRPGDSVTISWADAAGTTHSASVVLITGAAN